MPLKETLRQYIAEELLSGEMEIRDDDNLLADGMIDSVAVMRLVAFIEERLDQTVPPEDITIDHFRTLDCLVGYLDRKSAERGAPL